MGLVPASSHGAAGNTTAQVVASGQVLPVADPTSVTVDTTTYANSPKGSGHLTTLIFPNETAALAYAISGDAHPRMIMITDPSDEFLTFGNGTYDPYASGPFLASANGPIMVLGVGGTGVLQVSSTSVALTASVTLQVGGTATAAAATANNMLPQLAQLSPKGTITSGALPTATLSSGTGAQILTTRDCETVTPFSGDGSNNAATCAIALSPDNTTYSTLATISIAAALNLTGVLTDNVNLRVPAGWYIKLTAVHGTLGTTTYY